MGKSFVVNWISVRINRCYHLVENSPILCTEETKKDVLFNKVINSNYMFHYGRDPV